jgi:peptide-methionine (R)-S-oxide reductase
MATEKTMPKVHKSAAEWRQELSELQYRVTREKATEAPFSGKYWNCDQDGLYRCICCGAPLFSSTEKFESGCGWPSFSAPHAAENIETAADLSHHMHRTEVLCGNCGAHLGHLFPDGPAPTGERYCINSASLKLETE